MNDDTNLIDISMLQQLQDQFCCADHLYLMCVDKNKGVFLSYFSFFHGDLLAGIFNKDPVVIEAWGIYQREWQPWSFAVHSICSSVSV